MRRILFLLPDLDYRGHARQASLLASALPRDRFDVAVVSLSEANPMAQPLTNAGVPVHSFPRGHLFDFKYLFALRRLVCDWQPDLIHAWGLEAVRTLRYSSLLRSATLPPLIVSLPPSWLLHRRLSWHSRQLLSRIARFVGSCESDRNALAAAGLATEKIRIVHPGVPLPGRSQSDASLPGIPPGPILMACGHMHGFGRMMDAPWVAEILLYVIPNLQTVVIGEGSFRDRILWYFRGMPRIAKSVHFLGARPDAAELLALADVVLTPHRRLGGTFTTLEAMAAGRPVVATRLPHLEALIRDGETGMLANPADQPGLARGCLRLLENDARRAAIAMAARDAVARDFRLEAMAAGFAETYEEASKR